MGSTVIQTVCNKTKVIERCGDSRPGNFINKINSNHSIIAIPHSQVGITCPA